MDPFGTVVHKHHSSTPAREHTGCDWRLFKSAITSVIVTPATAQPERKKKHKHCHVFHFSAKLINVSPVYKLSAVGKLLWKYVLSATDNKNQSVI